MATVIVTSLSRADAQTTQGLSRDPTNPDKDQPLSGLVVTLSPVLILPLPRWRTNYPLRIP
jgi:hypothetical protein